MHVARVAFLMEKVTIVYIKLMMIMILAKRRISQSSKTYAGGSRSAGSSFLRARRFTHAAPRMRSQRDNLSEVGTSRC